MQIALGICEIHPPKGIGRMVALANKVSIVLEQGLSDAWAYLERTPGSNRLTGFVVSRVFHGKNDAKRQQILRKSLETRLSAKDLRDIGPIVAMTPEEASLHEN